VNMQKRVSLFGATGSIGDSTVNIVEQYPEQFRFVVLTANTDSKKLINLARKFQPDYVAIADAEKVDEVRHGLNDLPIEVLAGRDGLDIAAQVPTDFAMAAIVGFAGLQSTLKLIEQGTRIGLANKECLAAAGGLFMQRAKQYGAEILPVDSEHNAAFQLLNNISQYDLHKLTLTASGGPFRDWSMDDMMNVSVEQATNHPIWSMGPKITVDSATLMNKGLELIEAQHLFALNADQLDVLVHPQSVVHALITLKDGTLMSHKAVPDMRGPIAFCMGWPERLSANIAAPNLADIKSLNFFEPDRERFPCLALAEQAMHKGGAMPTILNAANEIAVQAFLDQRIGFMQISEIVEYTMAHTGSLNTHAAVGSFSSLGEVLDCDLGARHLAQEKVKKMSV